MTSWFWSGILKLSDMLLNSKLNHSNMQGWTDYFVKWLNFAAMRNCYKFLNTSSHLYFLSHQWPATPVHIPAPVHRWQSEQHWLRFHPLPFAVCGHNVCCSASFHLCPGNGISSPLGNCPSSIPYAPWPYEYRMDPSLSCRKQMEASSHW